MNVAVLTISTLSLVTSAATLGIVLFGAKKARKAQKQIEDSKAKINRVLASTRSALDSFEL